MITTNHKGDLGLRLPEKNKKEKVVVKEPETQDLFLSSKCYYSEVCPTTAMSPTKSVIQGQAPETPLVKKKEKKKEHGTVCEEHLEPETTLRARRTETSPSPRTQALSPSELNGEKRRRKSSWPPALSPGVRERASLGPRQVEEVTRVGRKLKKHREEKAQEAAAFSIGDPWVCEARAALHACLVGKGGQEQAALAQERPQGGPREHVKKKKTHQEEDAPLGHPTPAGSTESSLRKRGAKKPVTVEALEYIPVGDSPKAPARKKMKPSEKTEEPTLKRRKKKNKVAELWKEEPDPDLEVVLEKKGNMDEAHIDQVRRRALQEEIDRESGKTEASGTQTWTWTGTQFGQWDTAGFENEDQKLKFLKLMGGFKNLSPSFGRTPDTPRRPTMALDRLAARSLQQSLQRDYTQALARKPGGRAGLGFATSDKAFCIDRNASKSIKFED